MRVLALCHSQVGAAGRAGVEGRLADRRDYYRGARCRYWVFEESGREGSFIEFIEAPDERTLEDALAAAPEPVDGARIFHELELE